MHIGTKIKIARITKDLTQEELAEKINKTRPLVSHIEQTGKVNAHTLRSICKVLDIDPAALDEISEPGYVYGSGHQSLVEENRHLKEENAMLKELSEMQKTVIEELRQKLASKKRLSR